MCELFGIASRLPTAATFTLRRFAERGGLELRLIDGWGIALAEGTDLRVYREPEPARDSAWLRFIEQRRIGTRLLISHIRHATQGAAVLANTQPFAREIGGRMHCLAHNGRLDRIEQRYGRTPSRFLPLGQTDSELAACLLFDRMAALWSQSHPPPLARRLETVAGFAREMRELGPANFLYSDGLTLFAHGHRRVQANGRIEPPGLWRLHRHCECDSDALLEAGIALEPRGPAQEIEMFASTPLTDEGWRPLAEGEVIAV